MKNDLKLLLISVLLFALIFVESCAYTGRFKRLEADVEDLRLRVIYGVKP